MQIPVQAATVDCDEPTVQHGTKTDVGASERTHRP